MSKKHVLERLRRIFTLPEASCEASSLTQCVAQVMRSASMIQQIHAATRNPKFFSVWPQTRHQARTIFLMEKIKSKKKEKPWQRCAIIFFLKNTIEMCAALKKTNQTEGGEQLSHVDQKNGIKRKWKAVNASRGTPPTEKGNKNVQRKMAAVSIDSAGHSQSGTGKLVAVAAVAGFCVAIDDRQTVILRDRMASAGRFTSSAGTLAFVEKVLARTNPHRLQRRQKTSSALSHHAPGTVGTTLLSSEFKSFKPS